MHFVLVMVICAAFVPDPWFPVAVDASWGTLGTLLATVLLLALGESISRTAAWMLYRYPERRQQIIRRYYRARAVHFLLGIAGYGCILALLGWGRVVRLSWGLADWVLVDELLVLAPFLTILVGGWISYYRAERAIYDTRPSPAEHPFWGRFGYVMFHVRHYLGLVLAPILLFTLAQESIRRVPGVGSESWFQVAAMGLLAAAVLAAMPWLLVRMWGATRLADGPLRARLEAAARRLRFRYSDILVWNTRGNVANAMVTGLFPVPRFVLLSDCLIQHLKPEEIEAVFGHEVGHIKHNHMGLYLCFLMASLTAMVSAGEWLLARLRAASDQAWVHEWFARDTLGGYLPGLVFLGSYVWLVFGFLSRRCERQADVYGCKTVSCSDPQCTGHDDTTPGEAASKSDRDLCRTGIATFIAALEQVADLNGIRRDKPSWRHSSIARRVEFLRRLQENPQLEPLFQNRLRWTKIALFAGLAAVLASLWWSGLTPPMT